MSKLDPKLLQQLERERAERLAQRLTLPQLDAIVNDTRLPGEIAGAYGCHRLISEFRPGTETAPPDRNVRRVWNGENAQPVHRLITHHAKGRWLCHDGPIIDCGTIKNMA